MTDDVKTTGTKNASDPHRKTPEHINGRRD